MSDRTNNDWGKKIAKTIIKQSKLANNVNLDVARVKTVNPLVITYGGVDFSSELDEVFCNELLLQENIYLPVDGIYDAQTFDNLNPSLMQSPTVPTTTFQANVIGTFPDFVKSFYNWFKTWHNTYILQEQDYVIIRRIGKKRILVIEKVKKL